MFCPRSILVCLGSHLHLGALGCAHLLRWHLQYNRQHMQHSTQQHVSNHKPQPLV